MGWMLFIYGALVLRTSGVVLLNVGQNINVIQIRIKKRLYGVHGRNGFVLGPHLLRCDHWLV